MAVCPICGCKTDELDFVEKMIGTVNCKACSFCSRQLNVFDTNPGAKKCYEKAGLEVESFTENSLAFGAESWGHYRMIAKKPVE